MFFMKTHQKLAKVKIDDFDTYYEVMINEESRRTDHWYLKVFDDSGDKQIAVQVGDTMFFVNPQSFEITRKMDLKLEHMNVFIQN